MINLYRTAWIEPTARVVTYESMTDIDGKNCRQLIINKERRKYYYSECVYRTKGYVINGLRQDVLKWKYKNIKKLFKKASYEEASKWKTEIVFIENDKTQTKIRKA